MAGRRGGRGGKGKGGGSQGIRKRKGGRTGKNNPKRQRLAKVVEREDARDDMLDARYEARQAASRPRKPLEALTETRAAAHDWADAAGSSSDSDSDGEALPANTGTLAYDALVGELQTTAAAKRVAGADESVLKPAAKRPRAPGIGNVPRREGEVVVASAPAELKDMSGEAAARENVHFMAQLSSVEMESLVSNYYEYGASAVLSGIGKVSLAGPAGATADPTELLPPPSVANLRIDALGLQPSVLSRWQAWHGAGSVGLPPGSSAPLNPSETLSRAEAALALSLRSFRDVMFCRQQSPREEQRARQVVVAHALSHALRARTRVLRNDGKLKAQETRRAAVNAEGGLGDEEEEEGEVRDQGFARPRVLFLVPMRNDAYDIVSQITKLAVGAGEGEKGVAQIANRDRFEEEFAPAEGEQEQEEEDLKEGSEGGKEHRAPKKPVDWKHRFRGNVDDDFKLGVSLTKKTVKLYSDFYQSDILIASPLGLVRSMEVKKSGAGRKGVKKREDRDKNRAVDDWNAGAAKLNQVAQKKTNFAEDDEADDDGFLSSIEICVVDGASMFAMQNWSLLLSTLERVNNMPSRPRDTDFSRVRQWALDGKMRLYRQTVVLSPYKRADALSLFRTFSNHSGRVRVLNAPKADGTMSDVAVALRQRFLRLDDVASPADAPDRHFEHFMGKVLPDVRSAVDCQALVVIPNYFDFVRVRNALVDLENDEVSFYFASMSEYSKESDVARARTRFFTRKVSLLLMTERIHYYWRSRVRGANTIVWYGLPENGGFYSEIANTLAEAAERGRPVQSISIYDDFESFALERIVGSSRSKKMTRRGARRAYLFSS